MSKSNSSHQSRSKRKNSSEETYHGRRSGSDSNERTKGRGQNRDSGSNKTPKRHRKDEEDCDSSRRDKRGRSNDIDRGSKERSTDHGTRGLESTATDSSQDTPLRAKGEGSFVKKLEYKSKSPKERKRDRDIECEPSTSKRKARTDVSCSERASLKDRIFQEKGKAVVVLSDPETVALQGKADLQCLRGAVTVLGYTITASEQSHPLYSPDTNSLLTLSTALSAPEHHPFCADRTLSEMFSSSSVREDIERCISDCENSVVLLFSRLESESLRFLSSVHGYKYVFHCANSGYGSDTVVLDNIIGLHSSLDKFKSVSIPENYAQVTDWLSRELNMGSSPVVVVCGGKDVGKSTLGRYLINYSLNLTTEVGFLDCDLGQAEFTTAGCVSYSRVTSPVLGPPFTHQRKPDYCLCLGVLSPGDDPGHYMACLSEVYQKYLAKSKVPLIVNTMGWPKGIGLSLLVDTLRLVKPDLVVQLDSYSKHKNMPRITSDFVQNAQGWVDNTSAMVVDVDEKQHELICCNSVVSHNMDSQDVFRAMDHRNLSILSHLGQCVSSGALESVIPYEVPWSSVAVHAACAPVAPTHVMYALNGSIVALCKVNEQAIIPGNEGSPGLLEGSPMLEYLGCGLVRGIDAVKKVFYIITPLSPSECAEVNCLIRGALEVPQQLLLNQKLFSDVPYVGFPKDVVGASSVSRRRHMVRKRPTSTGPS